MKTLSAVLPPLIGIGLFFSSTSGSAQWFPESGCLGQGKPCQIGDPSGAGVDGTSITWVQLSYPRFEVFIDSAFYEVNTPLIDQFCDDLVPRHALLESLTGWRSEDLEDPEFAKKLEIYIRKYGECAWGAANPGEAFLFYLSPMYSAGCATSYWENGQLHRGNTGPLGDYWKYMEIAIHELVHAISPLPILERRWLTEGIAQYYGYNLLSMYNDINQETSDTELYFGNIDYRWYDYVRNDYLDGINYPIQRSLGYSITAWMITMLRDSYGWDEAIFHRLLLDNRETLWAAKVLHEPSPDYYIDACVIDFLGRSIGLDFESQTKPIFRYDGPDGPGWGVRFWTTLDWYPDLTSRLNLSCGWPGVGDTIDLVAEVANGRDVPLKGVVVRFYNGADLLDEQVVNVDTQTVVMASTTFSAPEGVYDLRVTVDEDNHKIEADDFNNGARETVTFAYCGSVDTDGDCVADLCDRCVALATPGNMDVVPGDASFDLKVNLEDLMYIINYAFKSGPAPQPVFQSGDFNCDGGVNSTDIIQLANYLFKSGRPPCDVCAVR